MGTLKPNERRAKNAITLIWIVMVLDIASLISGYFQYQLLQTAAYGGEVSIEMAKANDTREQVIGLLYMIAFIVSCVTFIQWFRRAYYNLQLKANHLAHTNGWTVGSWFIPLVCLYRPYIIMKELYQKTIELLQENEVGASKNIKTYYLGWWWALWVISSLLGQLIFRYAMDAETVEQLTVSTVANMMCNVIGIPLALLAIAVIKEYSKVEPLLHTIKDSDKAAVTSKSERSTSPIFIPN